MKTTTKIRKEEFSLSLVVPCYNEMKRLHYLRKEIDYLRENSEFEYEWILVDDGSTDDTFSLLVDLKDLFDDVNITVVKCAVNIGKGGALAKGVKHIGCKFFLTLDADMSTSPLQIIRWFEQFQDFPNDETLYIGSRQHSDAKVSARFHRIVAGKLFNMSIFLLTGLNIRDTQCGFKLYPADIGKELFQKLEEYGWAHDIELLLRAHLNNHPIQSLPVEWVHRDGAKISVISDGLAMLKQMYFIRKRLLEEKSSKRKTQ